MNKSKIKNKANKQKWLKALLSGKWLQGTGSLCLPSGKKDKGDEFCCLGVACQLAVDAGACEIEIPKTRGHSVEYGSGFDMNRTFLPNAVQEWLGVSTHDPYLPSKTLKRDAQYAGQSLAMLNDDGVDFKTIAYLIDKYL